MKVTFDMQKTAKEVRFTMSYETFIEMMSVVTTVRFSDIKDEDLINGAKEFIDEYNESDKEWIWDE